MNVECGTWKNDLRVPRAKQALAFVTFDQWSDRKNVKARDKEDLTAKQVRGKLSTFHIPRSSFRVSSLVTKENA